RGAGNVPRRRAELRDDADRDVHARPQLSRAGGGRVLAAARDPVGRADVVRAQARDGRPARGGVPDPVSTHASGLLIDRVSKELGGRTIVSDLDLEVRAGELTCLLGPSGCGKTTTLRMIAGFIYPDRGRILIDGQDVGGLTPDKRPTAMVFQNYALWPHMTVFKNVSFGLRLRKLPKREITERVQRILELVGL